MLLGLKILISAFLIWLLADKVSFADAGKALRQLSWPHTVAAFAIMAVSLGLQGVRWHGAALRSIPLSVCTKFTWVGLLYSMILPGALSGDVVKGMLAHGSERAKSGLTMSVSIALDRVAGLGVMMAFGVLSIAAWPGRLGLPLWLIIAASITMLVGLAAFPPICHRLLARRGAAPGSRMARLQAMLGGLSMRLWLSLLWQSTVIHAVNVTFFWVALMAVGGSESWWRMAIYTCLLNLAVLLPVSIAGIGVREQLSVWLLRGDGGASDIAVAFSWLVLAVFLAHSLIGLALQWLAWPRRRA